MMKRKARRHHRITLWTLAALSLSGLNACRNHTRPEPHTDPEQSSHLRGEMIVIPDCSNTNQTVQSDALPGEAPMDRLVQD